MGHLPLTVRTADVTIEDLKVKVAVLEKALKEVAPKKAATSDEEWDGRGIPPIGSVVQHINGTVYTVLLVANARSIHKYMYPTTVVYTGPDNKVWAKTIGDFCGSMRPTKTEKDLVVDDMMEVVENTVGSIPGAYECCKSLYVVGYRKEK